MKFFLNILIILSLSSCSVVAAASGSTPPDISAVQVGLTKTQVEDEIGLPSELKEEGNKTIATYLYTTGDEPSPGRAIAHGALDIITFFLWEYIAFPIEIAQGSPEEMTIEYTNNKVSRIIKKQTNEIE